MVKVPLLHKPTPQLIVPSSVANRMRLTDAQEVVLPNRTKLVRTDEPFVMRDGLEEIGRGWVWNEVDRKGQAVPRSRAMRIIGTMDHTKHGELLHISLSYENRDPSWPEIVAVKETFFGMHTDAMMVLPRWQDYVNHHEHTFHLWQAPTAWGLR